MQTHPVSRTVMLRALRGQTAQATRATALREHYPSWGITAKAADLLQTRSFPNPNSVVSSGELAVQNIAHQFFGGATLSLASLPDELQTESPVVFFYQGNPYQLDFTLPPTEKVPPFFTFAEISPRIVPTSLEIDTILNSAFQSNASDVIFKVGAPVMLKVQGVIQPFSQEGLTPEQIDIIIQQVVGSRAAEVQGKTDFDCAYQVAAGRLRVNIGRERGNPFIFFRLIPSEIPDFSTLQLPDEILNLVEQKRGIILVTGPVGTGKSTTLAAMLKYITQQKQRLVVTLEDPIEFLHRDNPSTKSVFVQREIGPDVPDFATGLRQALRENPDIILVGEMRDLETVDTAFNAALSGHLILGTLHTISAIQTVERIVSLFPAARQPDARMQLSLALKGIVSQALLPRKDGRGRIPCVEIMPVVSADIRKFIRDGEPHKIRQVLETHKKEGVYPFDNYLLGLYQKGLITAEVAMEFAQEPDQLHYKLMQPVEVM